MSKDPLQLIGKNLGKVKILQKLGQGGMGVVYMGKHDLLEKTVAIKVLPFNPLQEEELRKRFLREAKSAAQLDHPGIVQVYDIGQEEKLDYIVMQYVEGESLQRRLSREGALALSTALPLLIQTLEALDFAHERGIIHRDIKPDNLMITPEGKVKLADFGLARQVEDRSLTESGMIMGTPQFMSPEQARGTDIGVPSDIYALGVTFFFAITGVIPFDEEESALQILLAKANTPLPSPQEYNPLIPPAICQIINQMTHPDIERRYQNCRQILRDLEKIRTLPDERAAGTTQPNRVEDMPTLASLLPSGRQTRGELGGTPEPRIEKETPLAKTRAKVLSKREAKLFLSFGLLIGTLLIFAHFSPPVKKPIPPKSAPVPHPRETPLKPWEVRTRQGLIIGRDTVTEVENTLGKNPQRLKDHQGNQGWYYPKEDLHGIFNHQGLLVGLFKGKILFRQEFFSVLRGSEGPKLGKTSLKELKKGLREAFSLSTLKIQKKKNKTILEYSDRGIRYIFDSQDHLQYITVLDPQKAFIIGKDHPQSLMRLLPQGGKLKGPSSEEALTVQFFCPAYELVFEKNYLLKKVSPNNFPQGIEMAETLESIQKTLKAPLGKGKIKEEGDSLILQYSSKKILYVFHRQMKRLTELRISKPKETFKIGRDWLPFIKQILTNDYQEERPSPSSVVLIYSALGFRLTFEDGLLTEIKREQ